jgi:amino acid adenylation domain-containing protein/non-ribosomal peptide synthase protein (TIGR01720 family)
MDYRAQLTSVQAHQLSNCFSSAIASIVKPDADIAIVPRLIKDVDLLDDSTWSQLWQWNQNLPSPVEKCVHEMIAEQVKKQPTRPAVFAWDGEMTYSELDIVSTRLAWHLMRLGVQPSRTMVPICFDKSIWATVSILAVLKAGAAFVPIDLTQAIERREKLLKEINGRIILTSTRYSQTSFGEGTTVVAVNQELIASLANVVPDGQELENFDRKAPCYVLFTSGSTGLPKGVLTHHEAASTSCYYSGIRLGFSNTSRVFQFGAYTFDSSITENFTTLVWGGCICIPSNDDRMDDIPKAINTLQANLTFLTPTVANLIDPKDIPTLQTIILGGEATTIEDFSRWRHLKRVINGYGPTECTVYCVLNHTDEIYNLPARIGTSVSSVGWVADREDPERLLPIGAVGELLVEGHILALGYLNDPERTARTFIDSPKWMSRTGRSGRLYRTGDLVRYDKNGGLVYVERADTQVKVRGQRVELKEVEVQVSATLPHMQQVIAEVIIPGGNKSKALVAAFVVPAEPASESEITASDEAIRVYNIPPEIEKQLSRRLPSYAIPTVWFEVLKLPLTVSGKTNRRKLRDLGSGYSKSQLIRLQNKSKASKRTPTTQVGWKLLELFADVLGLAHSDIGLDDSFFRLGGDSVAAMKLASSSRKVGLRISVAQVFQYPKLEDLANLLGPSGPSHSGHVIDKIVDLAPFVLLDEEVDVEKCRQEAADFCDVSIDAVQDIYPCTPMQEGLVAQTVKNSGDYVLQRVMQLADDIDLSRFKQSWEQVIHSNPILRTRIIQSETCGLQQVVLDEGIVWRESSNLKDYLINDKREAMDLGRPLARYAIVTDDASPNPVFVWTIQHSIYDGGCMPLMLNQVEVAYHGGTLITHSEPKFNLFVRYMIETMDSDAALNFWKEEFAGFDSPAFPVLPKVGHNVVADTILERACTSMNYKGDITLATALRASLALTIHRQTGVDDVVFGMTLSGRNVPIPQIEEIVGPTITTIPVRVRVPLETTASVSEYVNTVSDAAVKAMPYEQTGIHRISSVSPEAHQACDFQTLLVIQPAPSEEDIHKSSQLGTWQNTTQTREFTTYAITIICQLQKDGGFKVGCAFDPNIVEMWRMERILDHFVATTQQILNSEPQVPLDTIAGLLPSDLEDIWRWHDQVPAAVDDCIHETIWNQAARQPDAIAVDGWDGRLTYTELMTASRMIASHLQSLGVASGDIVPLSFDKSTWAMVAMLAVLQSSAAFCHLDPTQASDRRERLLEQTGARLVLTSERYEDLDFGRDRHVVALGPKLLYTLQQSHSALSRFSAPRIDPDSLAYTIFTSGTTGQPKGVLVHHSALSSSCKYNGTFLRLDNNTRFLQFSSYTFDACMFETLTALSFGGCVCIPSQEEILGNLAGAIQQYSTNTAVMTPSVIRLLRPADVPSIKTLIFGGEPAFPTDFEPWLGSVENVVNVYGPTECTVVCCANRIEAFGEGQTAIAGDLGYPIGTNAWIVDPNDPQRLMPVGAVGELIIEGPLVTKGYLHDPDRTTASFLQDPSWLSPKRRGTVYKSGDLVRYTPEGRIVILGRKDKQVKIRGQRLELAEVEYHLQACMPHVEQLVVEIIPPTDTSGPNLAAFIIAADGDDVTEADDYGIHMVPAIPEVEDELSSRILSYMIPTLWFHMTRLPLSTAGKSDRRKLRELGAACYATSLKESTSTDLANKVMPSTKEEQLIQSVWARVLNINPETIGVHDSFLRLGGDSIIAMQVSSSLRSSLHVPVATILKHKTISRIIGALQSTISAGPSKKESQAIHEVVPGEFFDLSPIQQVFFGHQPDPNVEFDQGFFLKLASRVSYEELTEALDTIVEIHPMMRARFQKGPNDRWQQCISPGISASYALHSEECFSDAAVSSAISRCRNTLDITNGPVLAGALIESPDKQCLFLVVHHLVVDLVSWRIILQDLETLLTATKDESVSLLPPPLSFPAWCNLQESYAASSPSIDNPVNDVPAPKLAYWGIENSSEDLQDTTSRSFTISPEVTSAIFGQCNDIFRTKPIELLISTLLYSFGRIFSDRPLPTIWNEGHGREVWNDSLDLSRTCGWFTTMAPVSISGNEKDTLKNYVRQIKDCMRSMPLNGWAYFVSQFVNQSISERFIANLPAEIMFNYSGGYGQLERDDSFFQNIAPPQLADGETKLPSFRRHAVFDVLPVVNHGQLSVTFIYPRSMDSRLPIQAWIGKYQASLEGLSVDIVDNSHHQTASLLTLSDFPGAFESYEAIDEFHQNVAPSLGISTMDEIEQIYPTAPMQEGILISQAKDPKSYHSRLVIKVLSKHPTNETEASPNAVDLTRLQQAWKTVVQRHDLLRAVVVHDFPGTGRMMQVILSNPHPSIQVHHDSSESSVVQAVNSQDPPHYSPSGLQHHLAIHVLTPGECHLVLEINHAIVDGYSTAVLAKDLQAAYRGVTLALSPPSYGEYIAFVDGQPQDEGIKYWSDRLAGAEPCHFPDLSSSTAHHNNSEVNNESNHTQGTTIPVLGLNTADIREFCKTQEITSAIVVQLAWAIVLRWYTGSLDPSFGILCSGRDLPIDGVDRIFGPLIGMLTCRVDLDDTTSISKVLQGLQTSYVESLPYQTVSLAAVHNALKLGSEALFNSVISYQKTGGADQEEDGSGYGGDGVDVSFLGGHDPAEVSHGSFLHRLCLR